ncbi:MAG: peptidase T [Ruminococcaceae bacterium]|jgi:tripeptide aminopeptidase|nr:peptidase T [Oscillospiraceae bacterium]
MEAYERLIRYIGFDTASDEESDTTPSTACQFELARALEQEMRDMGLQDVFSDDHAYVYGKLPATPGYEDKTAIGFIAHIDTVTTGQRGPSPYQLIPDYNGGAIALGESGTSLTPEMFPDLKELVGETIITTRGTMVLGADDKAGVAEILTMCEHLLADGRPHGPVSVCFTPDEEIGHGASLLDLARFGAVLGYTVDGSAVHEIECETFNAAAAKWEITGVSVHPGSAKGVMINAAHVAAEIDSLVPGDQRPADTEGYEGFFHLTDMSGDVSHARMQYIIRDHDSVLFERRKQLMREIEAQINAKYGAGTAALTLRDQYRNMREVIEHHPETVEAAEAAIRAVGLEPVSNPIRGGTDGAQLSFRGLPCPNLGTGGYSFHGPFEHISVQQMDKAVGVLEHIVAWFAAR